MVLGIPGEEHQIALQLVSLSPGTLLVVVLLLLWGTMCIVLVAFIQGSSVLLLLPAAMLLLCLFSMLLEFATPARSSRSCTKCRSSATRAAAAGTAAERTHYHLTCFWPVLSSAENEIMLA